MKIILLCLTLFFLSADSYAKVVLQRHTDSGDYRIAIRGEIRPEDLSTFKKYMGWLDRQKLKIKVGGDEKNFDYCVSLDSTGGDVMTALAIGNLMFENQLAALVELGTSCSSACVYILASSVIRTPLSADINIHRPYSSSTDTSFAQVASDFAKIERIAVYQFKRVGVSAELWNAMMRVAPETTRRLSIEEIQRFGLLGADPAYEDAMDSRSAKRLGITKHEYLRRKAIREKCLEDEKAKNPDPYLYPKQYIYCSELAGI